MRPDKKATKKAAKKSAAGKTAGARDAQASQRVAAETISRKTGGREGVNDNHVGQVLRSVYQKAVDEDIPAEMLDLLSKLD